MKNTYSISKISDQEFSQLTDDLYPLKIPIEQSPAWGAFDDSLPNREFIGTFRFDDGKRLVAIASATLYRQKGRDWIWIKHGPLFASAPNNETLKKMCSTLKEHFISVNNVRPLFIRMNLPQKSAGLNEPLEHTMYDETVIIDLTKSEDEILAAMSQGGRRSIRKAQKENLLVASYEGEEAIKEFSNHCYKILQETGSRDGFGIHPETVYTTMLGVLKGARLYTVSLKKKVLAWAITTEYRKNALYYYGGSSKEARDLNSPYLLHFEIMKDMKTHGVQTYDFMGIAGKNYPSLASVTTFKLKFSKEITKVWPTYDLPLQPTKYKLLKLAIKTKRKLR